MTATLSSSLRIALVVACCGAATCASRVLRADGPTFNVQTEFSPVNNPNGPWQYGWASSLVGNLNLFTNRTYFSNNGLVRLGGNGIDANVHANLTDQSIFDTLSYPPRAVTLHPGSGGQFGVIDWVAPAPGSVTTQGRFRGLHNTTTDVHVYVDGVSRFEGAVQGLGDLEPFSVAGPLSVDAGDRVRFAVGFGANGNFEQDTTGLEAEVLFNPIPEPGASALAAIALAALGLAPRRCHAAARGYAHRHFQLSLALTALISLVIVAPARAEDWEPTPDGSGVIDYDAGLVWGALNSTVGGAANVTWANANAAARQYGQAAYNAGGDYSTGWRMPTLAESQTAVNHNAWNYFNLAWGEGDPACWTSTKQLKSYWAIRFMTGDAGLLAEKNGVANCRAVRTLENWEFREDLGGWLDHHTGLVWGPNLTDLTGSIYTWNGAQNATTNNYAQLTGFSGWRLPTLAEMQTAFNHNAFAYFQQNVGAADRSFWTSTEGKWKGIDSAYRFFFKTGEEELVGKGSAIFMIAVRRP